MPRGSYVDEEPVDVRHPRLRVALALRPAVVGPAPVLPALLAEDVVRIGNAAVRQRAVLIQWAQRGMHIDAGGRRRREVGRSDERDGAGLAGVGSEPDA